MILAVKNGLSTFEKIESSSFVDLNIWERHSKLEDYNNWLKSQIQNSDNDLKDNIDGDETGSFDNPDQDNSLNKAKT